MAAEFLFSEPFLGDAWHYFTFCFFLWNTWCAWGIPEEHLALRRDHSFMSMAEGKNTEFHQRVKYLISCFLWLVARGFGLPPTICSNQMNQMSETFRDFERVMCPPPPWASWFTKPPSKKKKKSSNPLIVRYCSYISISESSGSLLFQLPHPWNTSLQQAKGVMDTKWCCSLSQTRRGARLTLWPVHSFQPLQRSLISQVK